MHFIGVDTSCYTTSLACVQDQGIVCDERTMLSVPLGDRGLRQNDGVFQHVRNLRAMVDKLTALAVDVRVVGVSRAPREAEDSYMPVFEVGRMAAAALAGAYHAPLIETTHQLGHVRAALIGNESLAQRPFLALHISGGTTELLQMDGNIRRLGGSLDLHAGQLIDRAGVAMGYTFPAGPSLDILAQGQADALKIPASVKGMDCSFSGALTRIEAEIRGGLAHEAAAGALFHMLSRTLCKMVIAAAQETGSFDVLLGGGVSASETLRRLLTARLRLRSSKICLHWAQKVYGGDNAVGIALHAMDEYRRNRFGHYS